MEPKEIIAAAGAVSTALSGELGKWLKRRYPLVKGYKAIPAVDIESWGKDPDTSGWGYVEGVRIYAEGASELPAGYFIRAAAAIAEYVALSVSYSERRELPDNRSALLITLDRRRDRL